MAKGLLSKVDNIHAIIFGSIGASTCPIDNQGHYHS